MKSLLVYILSRAILLVVVLACPSLFASHTVWLANEGPEGFLVYISAEKLNAAGSGADGSYTYRVALAPYGNTVIEVPDSWYQVNASTAYKGAAGQYHTAVSLNYEGPTMQAQGMTGAQRDKYVFFSYRSDYTYTGQFRSKFPVELGSTATPSFAPTSDELEVFKLGFYMIVACGLFAMIVSLVRRLGAQDHGAT